MSKKIAIIGGGNLGTAIAEGLIKSGFILPEHIIITRRNVDLLEGLKQKGVLVSNDNNEAVRFAEVIMLCIKPFQVKEVVDGFKADFNPQKQMVVSVVSGVFIKDINEIIGIKMPVFRAMPNTAISIQESMTCICGENATQNDHDYVHDMFKQLGKTVTIDEKLMDAATVLGACGTAYAMRYIRANIQGGIEIGFSAPVASLIAAQTIKGAAELLLTNNSHPEQEIDKVTTPKGCTIAGLNEMEHRGFSSSLIRGLVASYKRITQGL